ncbi:hypothetical protein ACFB49_11930 [Sphingomonas sp. DBB INV C78]|uniref:hypothetical protein n=1 Tax=Sphingomonas sp. DBB INV C78 TaxID=3349434 RepID=UPI0036D3E9DD
MRLPRLLGLLAATALVASPIAAQAAPSSAAKLSLASATGRAGAPMQNVSRGEGNMTWLIVGGVVAAGVLLWIILDDDGGDDEPVSN